MATRSMRAAIGSLARRRTASASASVHLPCGVEHVSFASPHVTAVRWLRMSPFSHADNNTDKGARATAADSPSTATDPKRFCVVGSGPAGMYAADRLLAHYGQGARVDIVERLPTPFGLVRSGVAPDHSGTKAVTNRFDGILADPRVSFLGNVALGRDVHMDDLAPRQVARGGTRTNDHNTRAESVQRYQRTACHPFPQLYSKYVSHRRDVLYNNTCESLKDVSQKVTSSCDLSRAESSPSCGICEQTNQRTSEPTNQPTKELITLTS